MDLILTSLPGQFHEIHSPDKLCDHDLISGTLKIHIPHKKRNLGEKVFLYQKGNFDSMRKDASDFAKDFNGYSDNRSDQENFDLITSFIQESA